MLAIGRKLYKPWVLLLVTCGYIVAELGHFLIGVTSRATARDLHYGDKACQLNVTVSPLYFIFVLKNNINFPKNLSRDWDMLIYL